MTATVPHFSLNDGHQIPALGYGTGTAWMKSPGDGLDRKLIECVKSAIRLGYRHLDGAEVYGTEPELGAAIKESGVPRAEFFITTKLLTGMSNIPKSFNESLHKLGLEHVDLFLIHAPFFAKTPEELQEAWQCMELIHASGRARSIGVSNFTETHLKTILKTAKVKPAINQVEFHPCIDQRSLLAFAKQHDIRVAAFSSLTPTTKLPDAPVTHVVRRLAAKYGVDEGVILLRWVLGQHVVVVTTSGNETRLKGYLEVLFEETLSADEMKEIETQGQETSFRGFFSEEFKMLSPSSEVAAVAS